jgi:hypothetical protein
VIEGQGQTKAFPNFLCIEMLVIVPCQKIAKKYQCWAGIIFFLIPAGSGFHKINYKRFQFSLF